MSETQQPSSTPPTEALVEEVAPAVERGASAEEKSAFVGHALHSVEESVGKLDMVAADASKVAVDAGKVGTAAREAALTEGSVIARRLGTIARPLGIAGLALSGGVTAYRVAKDIQKHDYHAATEAVAEFGGGLAAGIALAEAGAALGALTGPAAPVAVPVLTLAGGIAGGFLGEKAAKEVLEGAEHLGHELKEKFERVEHRVAAWIHETFGGSELDHIHQTDLQLSEELAANPAFHDIAENYSEAFADHSTTLELGLNGGLDKHAVCKNFVAGVTQLQQETRDAITARTATHSTAEGGESHETGLSMA